MGWTLGSSPAEGDLANSGSAGSVPAVGAAASVLASDGTNAEWDTSPDVTSMSASSFVSVGSGNVASIGEVRGGSSFNIWARNAANNADLRVAGFDGSNNLYVGTSATAFNLHGNVNVALTPFQAASAFTFNGVISPTALSGDVNDYAPTGFATCDVMRLDGGAANRNITGLAGGAAGRYVIVHNIGTTNSLILIHASASSSAANRFDLSGAANLTIAARGSTRLWYDGTSSLWRVA